MSPDFPLQDSALDLLRACHAKMRSFGAGLVALAPAAATGDPRVRTGAAAVARYLREALPKHAEDEDQSITPRLLARYPELGPVLAALEVEHGRIVALLPALCADLDRLADGRPVDLAPFGATAEQLASLLAAHATTEEEAWFPKLETLPADELAAIRQEMARRRR